MYKLLFLTLLLASSSLINAQENLSKDEALKFQNLLIKAEGTYQIQMIDTRNLPSIPLSLILSIEEKRHETKIVYFYFKPGIRIKILPKQVILQKDFSSIIRIKHISSNEL